MQLGLGKLVCVLVEQQKTLIICPTSSAAYELRQNSNQEANNSDLTFTLRCCKLRNSPVKLSASVNILSFFHTCVGAPAFFHT